MILRFLAGATAILATQAVLAAAFVGIGLLPRRWFGLRRIRCADLFGAFWLGFALVLLLLLGWSFLLPIGLPTLALVSALGAIGFIASRGRWDIDRRALLPLAVALLAMGAWMAGIEMQPLENWDGGLYHIQAIKWIESYPTVPGLANLHGPLAFNNGSLLYDALLDVGPWEERAYHVANGLLVLALAAQALRGGLRLVRDRGQARPRHVFDLALLAPAVMLVHVDAIASYVTDVSTVLVLLAALSVWYGLLTEPDAPEPERAYAAVTVTTLLTAAVCLKLSAALFVAIAWPLALLSWIARARPARRRLAARTLAWAVTASGLLVGTWMGRGVVLSGYPLFPVTLAAAPVDWRAPLEHAEAELAFAAHSARTNTESFDRPGGDRPLAWLGEWWTSPTPKLFEVVVPALVALLGAASLWWIRRRMARSARPSAPAAARPLSWMAPPLAVGAAGWFLMAPAPRYGSFLFWGMAALLVAEAWRAWTATASPPAREARADGARVLLWGLVALGASPALVEPAREAVTDGRNPLLAVLRTHINLPAGPALPGLPPPPELEVFRTDGGVELFVPDGRCMDAPLPCTPNPAPNLRLRRAGELSSGFVVDAWRMRDWPYAWRPHYLPAWREVRGRRGATR